MQPDRRRSGSPIEGEYHRTNRPFRNVGANVTRSEDARGALARLIRGEVFGDHRLVAHLLSAEHTLVGRLKTSRRREGPLNCRGARGFGGIGRGWLDSHSGADPQVQQYSDDQVRYRVSLQVSPSPISPITRCNDLNG